jgi:hypothetical protein
MPKKQKTIIFLLIAAVGVPVGAWLSSPRGAIQSHHRSAAAGAGKRNLPPVFTRRPPTGNGNPGMLPGFKQDISTSKFALGTYKETRDEFGFLRTVGTEGVLGRRKSNGFVLAVPNGDAPSVRRPPLTKDGDEHNDRVLSYFLEAGLPKEQVKAVHASALMAAGGSATGVESGPDQLVAYTSSIGRALDGIPVPDSNAWARFNDLDEVVSEGSFWPSVPESVLAEAKALKSLMEDVSRADAYRAKLPTQNRDGRVVIRHSAPTFDAAPEYFAAYDVTERIAPGAVVTRHFDGNGQEFRLPHEGAESLPMAAKVATGGGRRP